MNSKHIERLADNVAAARRHCLEASVAAEELVAEAGVDTNYVPQQNWRRAVEAHFHAAVEPHDEAYKEAVRKANTAYMIAVQPAEKLLDLNLVGDGKLSMDFPKPDASAPPPVKDLFERIIEPAQEIFDRTCRKAHDDHNRAIRPYEYRQSQAHDGMDRLDEAREAYVAARDAYRARVGQ